MHTMNDTNPAVTDGPRWRVWLDFTRPFTLWPPALGMVSGGVTAWGAAGSSISADSGMLIVNIALGALMAAVLNAASNAVNQIYDLELDRVNKPDRPLPAGSVPAERQSAEQSL